MRSTQLLTKQRCGSTALTGMMWLTALCVGLLLLAGCSDERDGTIQPPTMPTTDLGGFSEVAASPLEDVPANATSSDLLNYIATGYDNASTVYQDWSDFYYESATSSTASGESGQDFSALQNDYADLASASSAFANALRAEDATAASNAATTTSAALSSISTIFQSSGLTGAATAAAIASQKAALMAQQLASGLDTEEKKADFMQAEQDYRDALRDVSTAVAEAALTSAAPLTRGSQNYIYKATTEIIRRAVNPVSATPWIAYPNATNVWSRTFNSNTTVTRFRLVANYNSEYEANFAINGANKTMSVLYGPSIVNETWGHWAFGFTSEPPGGNWPTFSYSYIVSNSVERIEITGGNGGSL